MNTIKEIKQSIADYFKKKYIRKELETKFKHYQIIMNKHNKDRLDMLTNSLFYPSKIIKKELIETERKRIENENELLFNDIKKVIDKHYKDREEALTKENEKLNKQLKLKNDEINEIKEKISTVAKS